MHAAATTKDERLDLVRRLRSESAVCRDASSDRWLRWLLRPALDAGATAADVLTALDRRPDGTPWTLTWDGIADLRNPCGWLAHRLDPWLRNGARAFTAQAARRQRAAVERDDRRAHQRVDREACARGASASLAAVRDAALASARATLRQARTGAHSASTSSGSSPA